MSQRLENGVRERRRAKGWSQEELAERAGISRAAVSAIEVGRLVPSTAAALALSAALGCSVEALFRLAWDGPTEWAWPPSATGPARYWAAEIMGRRLLYPVEPGASGVLAHDGIHVLGGTADPKNAAHPANPANGAVEGLRTGPAGAVGGLAERTLVVAGCDPAVGLLGPALAEGGVRLLWFVRSSGAALDLLRRRLVHAAGLHLGASTEENRELVRARLGPGYRLVHVARWSEGVAFAPGLVFGSVGEAVRARLRWAAREEGSAARQLLDELLSGSGGASRARLARAAVRDHRAVAEAIRAGWAQAGICVRVAAEEAGLPFLPVRQEAYDLCYAEALEGDARLQALLRVARSPSVRTLYAELPGYDPRDMGEAA